MRFRQLVLAAMVLVSPAPASAQRTFGSTAGWVPQLVLNDDIFVDAVSVGHLRANGRANQGAYVTGWTPNGREARGFFIFDVPAHLDVFSASLRIAPGRTTVPVSIAFHAFRGAVTDPFLAGGRTAWTDPGSARVYRYRRIQRGYRTAPLELALNRAAVRDLNRSSGGYFRIGARLVDESEWVPRTVLSAPSPAPVPLLIETQAPMVTPEPLTVSLLGGGLAAMAAAHRRRRPPAQG